MIYFIEAVGLSRIKIGYSQLRNGVQLRVESMKVGCPAPMRVLYVIEGSVVDERSLHFEFKEWRVHGEWFRASVAFRRRMKLVVNDPDYRNHAQSRESRVPIKLASGTVLQVDPSLLGLSRP